MRIDRLQEATRKHPSLRALLYPAILVRRRSLDKKYSVQREVVEALGELLVGDPVIKVDEFDGVFAVDVRGGLFARMVSQKEYEPQLAECCRRYLDPDRDAIDVGANVGFFTVLLAKNTSRGVVLSVEPAGNAVQRLRRNIELNDVGDRVRVFEGVASDASGLADLRTIEGREEYSTLGETSHPNTTNDDWVVREVVSATLDELVTRYSLDPGFVKVDVEGAEKLVFEGASTVLRKHRPVILSELSEILLRGNGSSAKEVVELIASYDYDVVDPIDPSIQPGAKESGDILCVPREMRVRPGA